MTGLLLTLALGDPCLEDGVPEGPVAIGLLDGGLGEARRACHRTEADLKLGGRLVAEPQDFYGHILATAAFGGSFEISESTEVFGRFEAFRYDTILSPFPSSHMGLGHLSLGASHHLASSETHLWALHGKAVLPTAFGLYEHAWPVGADLGVAWHFRAHERVFVHGNVSGLGSLAVSRGPVQPQIGLAPTVGVAYRPWQALGLAADVSSLFGYTAAVDVLAGGLAVRTGGERLGAELGVTLPVLGRERALAKGMLRASWRF